MSAAATTEQAWSRLRGALLGFFRRRAADEHLAEDLLQETFVRVHAGLGGLRSAELLEPWVWRVARNVLAEHRRRQDPARPAEDVDELDLAPPEEDRDGAGAEVGGWLPAMLALLPPAYREAVELADLQGLPQRELAERLGLTLPGAKSRVQRGRALLRRALADCCHVELDRRGNVLDWSKRERAPGCPGCPSC